MTLEKIKLNTLLCIKRQTPFTDFVHDQKNYYLESVTSNAQIIPLYDEQIKLNELKYDINKYLFIIVNVVISFSLFYGYLSLREHDAFLDEKDDLALMTLLLGFPLDDFASTLEREACEARSLLNRLADMLVLEAAKDLKRNGLQDQIRSSETDDREAVVVKSQNLIKQFNLLSGEHEEKKRPNFRREFSFLNCRHSTGACSSTRTTFNISNLL